MKKSLLSPFEKGQVALIVLLTMAVILTIGLSVVSRSVTDVKISQQSQEAARALWVAQAGLEKAIRANAGTTGEEFLNDIAYTVSKSPLGGGEEFVFPEKLLADNSRTFWLVGHDEQTGAVDESEKYTGSSLTAYWGNSGGLSDTTPALQINYIYKKSGGKFYSFRAVYDPYSTRNPPSFFSPSAGGGTVQGKTFPFGAEIILPNASGAIPYFLRLRILYADSLVPLALKAEASKTFPLQGSCFDASAKVQESGIVRRLNQCQEWKVFPFIFDYVLFSGGSL